MHEAQEIWTEHGGGRATVINATDVSSSLISSALADTHPEVAAMVRWGQQTRRGNLFERDKYLTPTKIYEQMKLAQKAAESDDVVAGVLESTEALTFSSMSVRCDDPDEENVWNQIIEDIDLDTRIREMWRELFTISQFYAATWWDVKSYKVKGRNKDTGVQRKKTFNGLRVPEAVTLLDPLKIIPVGNFMFNQDTLAWVANREEATIYDNVLSGREKDATVERLITGVYRPNELEMERLGAFGVGPSANLYQLNPSIVWRHTATRPQYKPFADVRMKSVFELLDLKNLLRELDRALLLGATNFIVLIRKGTENMPARQEELADLSNRVRTLSTIPVIVGDHRLSIEIITPKIDMSLQPEKYNTINASITARLYQMFNTGNYSAGTKGDDSMKLIRIVARGLESRRHQLRRSIEHHILDPIFERNDQLTTEPHLVFHPKSIAITFDPGLAAFFLDLFDRNGIPLETVLEQIDLDIDEEALKEERFVEFYKDTFKILTPLTDPEQQHDFAMELQEKTHEDQIDILEKTPAPVVAPPGGAKPPVKKTPANADPKSAGRSQGGNRKGGGAAPGTNQGKEADPRRPTRKK